MELNNEGVVNLMIALTERAYADYVIAGIRLKDCEYEIQDGVIHVMFIHGRPIKDKWEQNRVDRTAQVYNTAKMFFEGTKWGEYFIRKGNEEIRIFGCFFDAFWLRKGDTPPAGVKVTRGAGCGIIAN